MKNSKWSDNKIKTEVKKQYASLVKSEGKASCCGTASTCCSPTDIMKGNAVKIAGYSDEELSKLPDEAVENSFGCGNPLVFAEVKEGQTVLDIGSGAGIDCFIASEKVGKTGKVIGIDMTPEMIERASINAEDGGYSQVEFRLGEAEKMPVDDKSVDWVISNCVINLSPDKTKVFKEIFRVLKSGGQFSISDIVIGDSLPKEIANNMSAWTGCIAGTIKETDYLKGLLNSGLTDVKVESRIVYDKSMMRGFIDENTIPLKKEKIEQLLEQVEGKIWSAKIVGKKN